MIGTYFSTVNAPTGSFDMCFVSEISEDNRYVIWMFSSKTLDEIEGLNLRYNFSIHAWDTLIKNQEIIEINPPTVFIVTTKDTFAIKDKIRKSGGKWSYNKKKWYFFNNPVEFTTKEVLLFPFTGH